MLAVEGNVVGAPTFLIGGESAVGEARGGRAVDAQMPCYEAVVVDVQSSVGVVYGRTVERIAHHLSPVLIARIDAVVVIVVDAGYLVADVLRVVVVVGATLVFCVDVFGYDVAQPSAVFQFQFAAKHDVFKVVEEVAAMYALVPVVARAVAVVVDMEHLTIIFKEVVGIYRESP